MAIYFSIIIHHLHSKHRIITCSNKDACLPWRYLSNILIHHLLDSLKLFINQQNIVVGASCKQEYLLSTTNRNMLQKLSLVKRYA